MTITSTVQVITPDLAARLLEHNDKNRPVNDRYVHELASAIQAGEWRLNGEPIILNGDGSLLDGQHRLLAIIRADVPVPALVVSGVSSDVFDTIDQGRRRSAGNTLAIRGFLYYNQIAAAATWLWRYEHAAINHGRLHPTSSAVLHIVEEHPELQMSASFLGGCKTVKRILPPSVGIWLHWEFNRRSPGMAAQFFSHLDTGEGLFPGDPIYHLRERLQDNRASKAKLRNFALAALTIKAWNAYIQGRPLRLLKWLDKEEFPRIQPE